MCNLKRKKKRKNETHKYRKLSCNCQRWRVKGGETEEDGQQGHGNLTVKLTGNQGSSNLDNNEIPVCIQHTK